jgi:uncharacterized CHY-type Zn-finger protein
MVVISTSNFPPYGIACILCNDSLIAPNLSEYVSERHVRHSWFCESCDHRFETSEYLRFEAMSISPHPSLLPERCGLGVVPKIVAA